MSLDKVLYSCSLTHPQPALYHDGGGLVTKSCPTLVTLWTAVHQALLSMGISRQDYWGGLPFPSPGDFPYSGIEPAALALQADSLPLSHPGKSVCSLSLLYV